MDNLEGKSLPAGAADLSDALDTIERVNDVIYLLRDSGVDDPGNCWQSAMVLLNNTLEDAMVQARKGLGKIQGGAA